MLIRHCAGFHPLAHDVWRNLMAGHEVVDTAQDPDYQSIPSCTMFFLAEGDSGDLALRSLKLGLLLGMDTPLVDDLSQFVAVHLDPEMLVSQSYKLALASILCVTHVEYIVVLPPACENTADWLRAVTINLKNFSVSEELLTESGVKPSANMVSTLPVRLGRMILRDLNRTVPPCPFKENTNSDNSWHFPPEVRSAMSELSDLVNQMVRDRTEAVNKTVRQLDVDCEKFINDSRVRRKAEALMKRAICDPIYGVERKTISVQSIADRIQYAGGTALQSRRLRVSKRVSYKELAGVGSDDSPSERLSTSNDEGEDETGGYDDDETMASGGVPESADLKNAQEQVVARPGTPSGQSQLQNWLCCDQCAKWRAVSQTEFDTYQDDAFECRSVGRRCSEPDDSPEASQVGAS